MLEFSSPLVIFFEVVVEYLPLYVKFLLKLAYIELTSIIDNDIPACAYILQC